MALLVVVLAFEGPDFKEKVLMFYFSILLSVSMFVYYMVHNAKKQYGTFAKRTILTISVSSEPPLKLSF